MIWVVIAEVTVKMLDAVLPENSLEVSFLASLDKAHLASAVFIFFVKFPTIFLPLQFGAFV